MSRFTGQALAALASLYGFAGLFTPATAQVYTWVDDQGSTHYSDRPPSDGNVPLEAVTTVAVDQQAVTTVGNAGLREGEQALLDRFEARREADAARQTAMARQQQADPPTLIAIDLDDDRGDRFYGGGVFSGFATPLLRPVAVLPPRRPGFKPRPVPRHRGEYHRGRDQRPPRPQTTASAPPPRPAATGVRRGRAAPRGMRPSSLRLR
ncbi:MAG: DUF4124 domain-containing protein [Candidatus Competibacterales bacterium]